MTEPTQTIPRVDPEQSDADHAALVRAAVDRLSAWAPDTGRRARTALESGLPDRVAIAAECVRALTLPANAPASAESDRQVVLAALEEVARPVDPKRGGYIAGLRELADALEAHPEVPLPYEGSAGRINFHFLTGDDPKAAMAATVRALGGRFDKQVYEGTNRSYFSLIGQIAGLSVELVSYRDAVCTRVEDGVEEVVEEVPDPDALAAVPVVTVTRKVPRYRWECSPVLAGSESSQAVSQ